MQLELNRRPRKLPGLLLPLLLVAMGCYEGSRGEQGEPWEGGSGETGSDQDADGGSGSPQDDGRNSGGPAGDPTTDGDSGDPTSGGDPPSGDDAGQPPPDDDVPGNAYCADVGGWDDSHTQLENEILEIVNQRRAEGANCGSAGSFGPAAPITMNPALRCAARVHSKDMVDRGFFDHTNPSGESPFDRMVMAGYTFSTAGENIAAGNNTAAATMQQWMDSDGHCSNIMRPEYTELGVGYFPGGQYGHVWTQAFGAP